MSQAPREEVWKLLYDPSRFPEWWAGIGTVKAGFVDIPEREGQLLETERTAISRSPARLAEVAAMS